jgi:hypothetical protein
MHDMDLQPLFDTPVLQVIRCLLKMTCIKREIRDHDHRKQILQDFLRHVYDVDISFRAVAGHECEDARTVFPYN